MADDDPRPAGARVTLDMIGSSTGDRPVAWTERETMLYAVGVGAGLGDPAQELGFTTENSGGIALQAVPSFLTILTVGQRPPAMEGLDIGRFLHAEQRIELLRPLPPAGTGFVETRIESLLDKGAGAILTNVATLRGGDEDPAPIGRVRSSIFIRGAGGFGGPRGTAGAQDVPDRPADARITHQTRPEQPLLYRLSGDRHRLHSDPPFAQERGFTGPIMHGLCTYGFACRALVAAAAGGDPLRLRAMEGRFSRPAYPGDTLTTEIWFGADGHLAFRTLDGSGQPVLDRGTAIVEPIAPAASIAGTAF